jgi:hypothetical protein
MGKNFGLIYRYKKSVDGATHAGYKRGVWCADLNSRITRMATKRTETVINILSPGRPIMSAMMVGTTAPPTLVSRIKAPVTNMFTISKSYGNTWYRSNARRHCSATVMNAKKLKGRKVAGYIMRDAGERGYNVVAASDNSRETTYLFYLYKLKNPPSNDASDLLYIICEDRPCTEADVESPTIYNRGPAHPSLLGYLAHPYSPSSSSPKTLISSTHIVYGVWVARVIVGDNK